MIDNKYEKIIEFNKIKELWSEFAYTDYAKDKIKDMEPYISEAELIAKLRETSQSKTLIEKCGNPPLVSLDGIEDILESAKRGQCLSVSDLVSIENAITAFGRMKAYLKRGTNYNISIAFYEENIDMGGYLMNIKFLKSFEGLDLYQNTNLSKPVIIIHGEKDMAVPIEYGKKYASMYPNCEFYMVPDSEHCYQRMSRRSFVNDHVIEFLGK